jgi:hypothetical protein
MTRVLAWIDGSTGRASISIILLPRLEHQRTIDRKPMSAAGGRS